MSASSHHASPFTRATKVIAVADVVESVRLMELGEQDFIDRWHRFVNFVHDEVTRHSGRLHKSLGDGLMLEFADAAGCIRAARAMQDWFRQLNEGLPPEQHVHLRIGAHLADYVADKYDIYGTDVNVAARIAGLAGPGEVVISAALRERLGAAVPARLEDLGPCHLKHVKHPVHTYRIAEPGAAPPAPASPLDARGLRATVAVLPFGTRGEALDGISAETLADELVAALARSDALQVVSRMTTAPLDATRDTLQTVLSQVNARYVLTGRARRHDDGLALFAELADAPSGHVIWADSFQSACGAAGLLDGLLLGQVISAVHAAVVQHEIACAQTRPLRSLDGPSLLLAAVGLMQRLSPVDMEQARGLLEHLLERWRRHPTAHAWLAHLHLLRVQQATAGFTQHDAALARAHAAAAAQADPSSPLVLALHGHVSLHGSRNLESAAERYAQALSARPNHSLAQLFQAELLAVRGAARSARHAAARATHALSLEPLRYLYEAIAAFAALADRDAEAAVGLAQQALQRNPRYLPAWRTLVVALVECERMGEARASQQQLLKRQPAFNVRSFLDASVLQDELEARFADALVRAGAPAD